MEGRKSELEQALRDAELALRGAAERIATPVPCWAIENWVLDLLGYADVNEDKCPVAEGGPTWKQIFEQVFGGDEKRALTSAAEQWSSAAIRLPSLGDGRVELSRIEQ